MENTHKEKETVLKALSNSTRREIMRQIVAKKGATYTEMMEILGLDSSLKSGKFNYHLKELVDAGLILQMNGIYKITDLGEKALILIDQVSKETKIDSYGVLHAAISMNPREELRLFKSQLGFALGFLSSIIGITISLIPRTLGILDLIVAAILTITGFIILGWSFRNLVSIIRHYGLGISSLLLLDSDWFLIRSPNRSNYILMMLFGVIGMSISLIYFALFYSGVILFFSSIGIILICAMSFFWILFIALMKKTTQKIEELEGLNNE